ncbi:ABC-three component system protein [Streptomyces sp. NPDC051740]|uniref:ABC-three component system protein n=1 Tax=Streptomyces sp. NPDC051740 TaxID=3365673 RepID=UPI00379C5FB7
MDSGAQRAYAKLKFREKLADLHGESFETFFHNLMCVSHPDFVDVRTYGRLGDQGSDGLSLHAEKLYACYAPGSFKAADIRKKFRKDLESALRQRPGQFRTFVFVHNDPQGVHPELATCLAEARNDHPGIGFEQIGPRRLWTELLPHPREVVEDLLGCDIPIEAQVFGISMENEVARLLDNLKERRRTANPLMALDPVNEQKIDFNGVTGDERDELVTGMGHTWLVAEYYAGLNDPFEEDEVAAGFTGEYRASRARHTDPADVLLDLQLYIHGNRLQHLAQLKAGWVVLAYFFERCHVFENPPDGWTSGDALRISGAN